MRPIYVLSADWGGCCQYLGASGMEVISGRPLQHSVFQRRLSVRWKDGRRGQFSTNFIPVIFKNMIALAHIALQIVFSAEIAQQMSFRLCPNCCQAFF